MLGSGGASGSPGPYVAEFENNYTFAPKVKDLPQSVYGSHVAQRSKANSQVPVIDRTHAWLADVERDRQALSEGIRSAEEESCTFTPWIPSNSRRILSSKNVERQGAPGDRLYADSARIAEKREQLNSQYRQEEEEKFSEECTFKPAIPKSSRKLSNKDPAFKNHTKHTNASRRQSVNPNDPPDADGFLANESAAGVNMSTSSPRKSEPTSISQVSHRRDQWLRKEGQGSAPETDQECTFSPRINQVRGDMEAASEYLKQNVCERLSRATPYSSYSGGPGTAAGMETGGQRNTSFDGLSGVSTATSVSNMSTVASKKAPVGTGAFGQFPKSKGSGVDSKEAVGGGGAVLPPPSPGRGQFEYVSMAERVRRASEDNLSVAESTNRSMDGTGTSVTVGYTLSTFENMSSHSHSNSHPRSRLAPTPPPPLERRPEPQPEPDPNPDPNPNANQPSIDR